MDPRLKLTIPPEDIESKAWDQIKKALENDFLLQLAIMPDVHAGYDLPIGGVALLDGKISPSYVGYDIGCGMCHVTLKDVTFEDIEDDLGKIYAELQERIPTGFNQHEGTPKSDDLDELIDGIDDEASALPPKDVIQLVVAKAKSQFGTLGGGNHFLQVGANAKNEIGITIHSGSRKPGHSIGGWYMEQGSFFDGHSELGVNYQVDMAWALEYALENRLQMMKQALDILGVKVKDVSDAVINENHNHSEYLGSNTFLHRKGATPAEWDQLGIIPANIRDGVYITRGLGNEEYLNSASHGCGRVMGRNQAKKTLDLEAFKRRIRGIICPDAHTMLDEAPDAYKDHNYVLNAQKGLLVQVIDHFRPLVVLKG